MQAFKYVVSALHKRALPVPGQDIGGLRVLAEVAHGGMAAIYAVQRKEASFDKLLAIKMMLPHLASERRFVEMFLDESRIAARLSHPNIVSVHDVGEWLDLPYFVMEYLRGQPFSQLLERAKERQRPLPPGVLCGILAQTARGLHAAHEATGSDGAPLGVVHRDVSPQNIHLGYDGQVRVVDFGIAAARGRLTATRTGEVKGKLSFLAPEQIDGGRVDRRTDLWALGVVGYEAFTGERLFRAEDDAKTIWAILSKPIPPLPPLVPAEAAAVLLRCVSRSIVERPSTAAEVAEILEGVASPPPEIARFVCELFAREQTIEEERLAAATRQTPPPPLVPLDTSTPSVTLLPEPSATLLLPEPRSLRTKAWRWAGGALLAAGGLALSLALRPGAPPPMAAPVVSEAAPAVSGAVSSPAPARSSTITALFPAPAPSPITVRVEVAEDVRLVLVNGQRVDARPLLVELTPGKRATLEYIDASGAMHQRVIGEADQGLRLGGAARRAKAPPAARKAPRPAPTAPRPEGELMDNPY